MCEERSPGMEVPSKMAKSDEGWDEGQLVALKRSNNWRQKLKARHDDGRERKRAWDLKSFSLTGEGEDYIAYWVLHLLQVLLRSRLMIAPPAALAFHSPVHQPLLLSTLAEC